MRIRQLQPLALLAAAAFVSTAAHAQVAKISACYYATSCAYAGSGVVDGVAFRIANTSTSTLKNVTITLLANATLGVPDDTYSVGAIAAGANSVVIPGLSNDGASHPTGGIFTYIGAPLDESDNYANADNLIFRFRATVNGLVIRKYVTVGKSAGPSNDGSVGHLNFLGGPSGDPCADCFGPKIIGKF